MTERKINLALKTYARRWNKTDDEMASYLQEDWSGFQYQKYISQDRLEPVKVSRSCKVLSWPFPDSQLLMERGKIGEKIKGDLVDADLTVRQAIIRGFRKMGRPPLRLKKSAEQKYINRAYQFLNGGFDPIMTSILYHALEKPCVSVFDLMNKGEIKELMADMEEPSRQLEFAV